MTAFHRWMMVLVALMMIGNMDRKETLTYLVPVSLLVFVATPVYGLGYYLKHEGLVFIAYCLACKIMWGFSSYVLFVQKEKVEHDTIKALAYSLFKLI